MWTQRAREYGPMCLVLLCTGAFLRVETARLAARGDDVNRLQSEVAALDARATRLVAAAPAAAAAPRGAGGPRANGTRVERPRRNRTRVERPHRNHTRLDGNGTAALLRAKKAELRRNRAERPRRRRPGRDGGGPRRRPGGRRPREPGAPATPGTAAIERAMSPSSAS